MFSLTYSTKQSATLFFNPVHSPLIIQPHPLLLIIITLSNPLIPTPPIIRDSRVNTWGLLITELLYLSMSRPQPFCSYRWKGIYWCVIISLNKMLNSIYFYSKNVFTTKGWWRWEMCYFINMHCYSYSLSLFVCLLVYLLLNP